MSVYQSCITDTGLRRAQTFLLVIRKITAGSPAKGSLPARLRRSPEEKNLYHGDPPWTVNAGDFDTKDTLPAKMIQT